MIYPDNADETNDLNTPPLTTDSCLKSHPKAALPGKLPGAEQDPPKGASQMEW